MHASLTRLQNMVDLSLAMVEAARANDWERLIDLENAVALLRNAWQVEEPAGQQPAGLTAEEQRIKAELIGQMLAADAEVRTHTTPFLEVTRKLLSGSVKGRAMRNAYGG